MANYENQLLDAIQIIVDNAIEKANFDKTIQAVVQKCVSEQSGKYVVKYQGGTFYAYSQDIKTVYSKGTSVYVLIPGNDNSKTKTILGTVDKLGENYILADETVKFENNGGNCLEENSSVFGLCSYNTRDEKILYNIEDENSPIMINQDEAKAYLTNSNYLTIAAGIRTELPNAHKQNGNYGIEFILRFKNPNNENIDIERSYSMDINDMSGDPYNYVVAARQYKTFEIDKDNYKDIKEIKIYCEKFVNTTVDNKPNDIFFSAIELKGQNLKDDDKIIDGYYLSLMTKQGTYFTSSTDNTKRIEALVQKDGIVQKNAQSSAKYYWFIEDNSIYFNSPEYLSYGGTGWRCLNTYETLDEDPTKRKYNSDLYYKDINVDLITAKQLKIKCVAIYEDRILSNEILFYNRLYSYLLYLYSDIGDKFGNDAIANIDCVLEDYTPIGNLNYYWAVKIDENEYTPIENNNSNKLLNQNLDIALKKISYICTVKDVSVSYTQNLGSAEILLKRYTGDDNNYYHIELINGNQTFKYDVNGVSPTIEGNENGGIAIINNIDFILYDEQGNAVAKDQIRDSDITWTYPTTKTLIRDPQRNNKTLSFKIADVFNYDYKDNNTITLSIAYDNKTIKAKTNLLFIKDGYSGTNGTEYYCRIVPNTSNEIDRPIWIQTSASAGHLNYNYSQYPFKVSLYKNGEEIYNNIDKVSSDFELSYEIISNNYFKIGSTQYKDTPKYVVTNTSFNFNNATGDNYTYIVRATIKYNNVEHYATIPVIYQNNNIQDIYSIKYPFNTVLYSNDGTNPKYDKNNTEFKIYENGIDITENVEMLLTPLGKICNKSNGSVQWVSTNNIIIENNKIIPSDTYNGYCVSNGVKLIVRKNNVEIINMYYPIDMYLNRYGNAAMNKWNGNAISLDDEHGAILAPQVGAGKKNNDNSFTGIFMGEVNQDGNTENEIGLFGYNNGERTIELNAEDGSAKFGKAGKGQVVLVPNETNEHAYLRSGDWNPVYGNITTAGYFNSMDLYFTKDINDNYIQLIRNVDYNPEEHYGSSGDRFPNYRKLYILSNEGRGFEIDMTDPHIWFGNNEFRIDRDGTLHAPSLVSTSGLSAGSYEVARSSIPDLDTDIENLNNTTRDLENSISYLDIELDNNTINVPTDVNRYSKSGQADLSLTYVARYKGTPVPAVAHKELPTQDYTGITAKTPTIDPNTSIGTIGFSFNSSEPIQNDINSYTYSFTYTVPGTSTTYTINKSIFVNAVISGKDGTSVTVKGTYPTLSALKAAHPTGNLKGDGYVIGLNLYVNISETGSGSQDSDWSDVGQFKGEDGHDGVGIQSITYTYAVNNTATTAPSNYPYNTVTDAGRYISSTNKYLWQKEVITYTNNTNKTSYLLLSIYGDTGKGISSISYLYKRTTNGTKPSADSEGWETTEQALTDNYYYLWQKETITYTDNSTLVNVFLMAQRGVKGDTGNSGESVLVDTNNVTIEYAQSQNGVNPPSTGWSNQPPASKTPGWYIWTKIYTPYKMSISGTSAGSSTSYSVSYTAVDGENGPQGKNVEEVVQLYYLKTNSTTPTKPTSHVGSTSLSPNQWTTLIPSYASGGIYYTCNEIKYQDQGSISYSWTSVAEEKGLNNAISTANAANATANTANTNASNAVNTANTANTNASNAVNTANTANTNASSAVTTANTANTNASNAVTTANTANTNASNALTKANASVKSEQIHYLATSASSGVTTSTQGWTTSIQTITETNKYLWTYITYTKADNTTSNSTPVITGVYGNKGATGSKGDTGSPGTNASLVDITASSQVFKSTDGGLTFSPDTIVLTPRFQTVSYSKWQYSINGGSSWTDVTSGQHGLTINSTILTISKDSDLYSSSITSIIFRCLSSNSNIYDTITILKLYDVTDLEIGGRNVVLGTSTTYTVKQKASTNAIERLSLSLYGQENLLGKTITISADIQKEDSNEMVFKLCLEDNDYNIIKECKIENITTDFKKYIFKINLPSTLSVGRNLQYFSMIGAPKGSSSNLATYNIKNIKVELGHVQTDWTIAPEDIDDNFAEINTNIADLNISVDVLNNQKKIESIIYEYALSNSNINAPAEDSNDWKETRPTSEEIGVNGKKYIWTRIKTKYLNDDVVRYTNVILDPLYSKIQSDIENAKASIRNEHSWMTYGSDALTSYNETNVSTATRAVKINAGGIILSNRASSSDNWNDNNIWTADGLNLENINVNGLTANKIKDGDLEVQQVSIGPINQQGEFEESIYIDGDEFVFNHNSNYTTALNGNISNAIYATDENNQSIFKVDYYNKKINADSFSVKTDNEETNKIKIGNIEMFSSTNPQNNNQGIKIMGVITITQ